MLRGVGWGYRCCYGNGRCSTFGALWSNVPDKEPWGAVAIVSRLWCRRRVKDFFFLWSDMSRVGCNFVAVLEVTLFSLQCLTANLSICGVFVLIGAWGSFVLYGWEYEKQLLKHFVMVRETLSRTSPLWGKTNKIAIRTRKTLYLSTHNQYERNNRWQNTIIPLTLANNKSYTET